MNYRSETCKFTFRKIGKQLELGSRSTITYRDPNSKQKNRKTSGVRITLLYFLKIRKQLKLGSRSTIAYRDPNLKQKNRKIGKHLELGSRSFVFLKSENNLSKGHAHPK